MKTPQKYGRRYPWDTWFKRSWFRLVRGTHYDVRPDSMAQLVRFRAKDRGLRVSVTMPGEGILKVTIIGKVSKKARK